jgi:hypothetical protein
MLNLILLAAPIISFVLGYFMPDYFELLAFLVCIVGGFCSFILLGVYGYTNYISVRFKEAALYFLLGDLVLVFMVLLKPV